MEYKSVHVEVKAIEDRTVTGIFSVFGNKDSYDDVIHKGAFKKTIQDRFKYFRHLWQHDFWSPPIAKIEQIREVGKSSLPEYLRDIPEVTGGVEVTRTYLNTERGNEVLEGLKSGAITEMSFAFDAIKWDIEEQEEGKRIRNIREVRLWETSDVLWGANPLTAASRSLLKGFEPFLENCEDITALEELQENILRRLDQIKKNAEPEIIPLTSSIERMLLDARIARLEIGG